MTPATAQRMARRHGELVTLRRKAATVGIFYTVTVRASVRRGTPEQFQGDRHTIEHQVTVAGADLAQWADEKPSAELQDSIVIDDVAFRVHGVEPKRLPGGVSHYVLTVRGPV